MTEYVGPRDESRTAEGERVLLLVQGERDRELLADRLGERQVLLGDPEEPLPEFDLCLVDTTTYPEVVESLAERKGATATYLPVLLVLGPRDSEAAAREVAELPDDVLSVPAAEGVFEARVESLLRARRQSVELDAQREQLARYRRAMDDASAGITISDAGDDQPLTYVNDAFCEITGYDRGAVLGRNCRFLQGPDTDEEPVRRMREAIDAGEAVEVELRNYRRDGTEFWNHLEISPVYEDGELTAFLGFQQDVTGRREMAERLREETETMERLLETSPVGITVLNPDGEIVRANEAAESVLGLERSDVLGRTFDAPAWRIVDDGGEEIPSEDLPFSRVMATGEPVAGYEHAIEVDGKERWLSINAAPLTDGDGTVVGVVNAIEDITQRRARQRALERERERFRSLAETAADAIVTIDPDGVVRYANSAIEDVFGYAPGELEGESLTTLIPERFRSDHERGMAAYLETGERTVDWTGIRFPGLHADGHEVPLSVSYAEYEVAGEQRFTGIMRDVTEQVERERELEATSQAFRRLYEVAADPDRSFDEKLSAMLALGANYLGVDYAFLSRIDRAAGIQAIVAAHGDHELLQPGESGPLAESYCRRTLAEGGRLAVRDAVAEGWADDPAYERFDLGCYVGARVQVGDELHGTLAFTADDPRAEPFNERERGLADLLSQWVAYQLDRRDREATLEQTLDLFERTQAIADVGGWEVDPETLSVTWTDQVFEILGLPVGEEPPLEEALDVYHPDDRPVIEAAVEDALEQHEPIDEVARIQRPDGETRSVRVLGEPAVEDGEVVTLRGAFQDVTERVERERELERTLDLLDRAEAIADVGGWEYDPASGELFWTDQVYGIHDIDTTAEVDVDRAIEFYHPEDRPTIQEAVERAVDHGESYDLELRIVRPGGAVRWVRTQGEPGTVDGSRVVRGTIQDIHERKRRERELERTVDQLRQTRDIAAVSGWSYDPETDEVEWGEQVWEIYDLPPSFDPTTDPVLERYAPADRERIEEAMRRAIVSQEPFDMEVRLNTDPVRWVRVSGEPQVEDGRTTSVRGVVRNVTQRKRREQFLQRYERIVEAASDPIYTLDEELRFTLVNGAVADLHGERELSLVGEHVSTVLGETHAEALADAVTKLVGEGEDRTTIETTVTDADGVARCYQTTLTVKPDGGEAFRGVVCVSRDITALQERERRLSVLDRVLRHNLRNKMNVVLAQAAMALEATEDEAVGDAVEAIEGAAGELLDLAEDARQFHGSLDPDALDRAAPTDVAEHARHVVAEAGLSYDGVTVEADIESVPPALAQPEFELALSELVDNAATHGGSEVTVSVDREGDEVIVRVADDGPGFPAVERRALAAGLESPLQHTTGLGLWFVRWTVTNSGGSFHIEDRNPSGTVIELRLPVVEE